MRLPTRPPLLTYLLLLASVKLLGRVWNSFWRVQTPPDVLKLLLCFRTPADDRRLPPASMELLLTSFSSLQQITDLRARVLGESPRGDSL